MREKKKTMSTKKKSAKEKNPNTCVLWVFLLGVVVVVQGPI